MSPDRAMTEVRSLSRSRERVGERVLPQWDNPQEEKALTRRFAPTSPASGRGCTEPVAIDST
ncbi:hypothetical protein GA0061099_1001132 [Bradyrhizobium yuanmingense]|uniref:Uncharacterized protein n=1 Tax=Bradyrhizobium yuanmingense TaxID=108015 RepID=A0A1C3TWM2_9BRAD|nr:hypothetical protein IQ15_01628 [Bradyrhizobium yuanmingense]SCB07621.1 hypothetical protein GA0061099_1001132 [Bradyrhizobium yuanmingense]